MQELLSTCGKLRKARTKPQRRSEKHQRRCPKGTRTRGGRRERAGRCAATQAGCKVTAHAVKCLTLEWRV